jgi:hypothetical protein
MANYVWQLGIDWNAVETAGVSYLRGGLLKDNSPSPGTNPVHFNDTITFKIFDVNSSVENSGRQVTAIGSFVILTTAAVTGQVSCNSLSSLQPAIGPLHEPAAEGSLFGNAHCSWDSELVTVTTTPGRFLLTLQVQVLGPDGRVRIFRHDPEMVVGPNG